MEFRTYSLGLADLIGNANGIKEALLLALERDGLLKKPASEIAETYAVILVEPGWLGRLFRKVTGEKNGELTIRVVREI